VLYTSPPPSGDSQVKIWCGGAGHTCDDLPRPDLPILGPPRRREDEVSLRSLHVHASFAWQDGWIRGRRPIRCFLLVRARRDFRTKCRRRDIDPRNSADALMRLIDDRTKGLWRKSGSPRRSRGTRAEGREGPLWLKAPVCRKRHRPYRGASDGSIDHHVPSHPV
jgi:hypothetical protein